VCFVVREVVQSRDYVGKVQQVVGIKTWCFRVMMMHCQPIGAVAIWLLGNAMNGSCWTCILVDELEDWGQ